MVIISGETRIGALDVYTFYKLVQRLRVATDN